MLRITLFFLLISMVNIAFASSHGQECCELLKKIEESDNIASHLTDKEYDLQCGCYGVPLIFISVILECKVEALDFFYSRGSSLSSIEKVGGLSLIHYAAGHKDTSCLRYLLRREPNLINMKDPFGFSLNYFGINGGYEAIMILREAGLKKDSNINLCEYAQAAKAESKVINYFCNESESKGAPAVNKLNETEVTPPEK